jgi:hypothetical protein
MRTPSDEQFKSPESQGTPVGSPALRRPPGGKALLRLLDFLRQRGYTQAANLAVERAAAENDRNELRSLAGMPAGDVQLLRHGS